MCGVYMKRIGSILFIFILSLIIYFLIVRAFDLTKVITGIVLAFITALLASYQFPMDARYFNPVRWFWFLVYIPVFLKEMLVANIKIAGIVLSPSLPVKPELKIDKTVLKSKAGILMLTSSITLTPGTLSVEANGDEITIHCVNSSLSAREIMEPFEKLIVRITE